jgi:hypothetical protein
MNVYLLRSMTKWAMHRAPEKRADRIIAAADILKAAVTPRLSN